MSGNHAKGVSCSPLQKLKKKYINSIEKAEKNLAQV